MEGLRFRGFAETGGRFGCLEAVLECGASIESPFTFGKLTAVVETPKGEFHEIEGFCDSVDGSVFRVRYMPLLTGKYVWRIRFGEATWSGVFNAQEEGCPGMLQADGWNFRWSGTNEPFFWNATTTYLILGLREDRMFEALDRLASYGINRIRVSLCATRQKDGGRWYEPQVKNREDFTYHFGPWPQGQPESQSEPKFDTSRFDVVHYQKLERLIRRGQELGIIIQVIFFTDAQEDQNYPFDRELVGDNPAELRYYEYSIARLASFWNVEWCVTNEWALFRPDEWPNIIGEFVKSKDVYGHLLSVHGHERFPYNTSTWTTHMLFQLWDEHGGYDWAIEAYEKQKKLGKPMPIVNEEYGYEDHYSPWGDAKVYPARLADTRRRFAWEHRMAGCWQTTGESAKNGLGGWINGLGNEEMTMLVGYRHIKSFFESFDYSKLEPSSKTISKPNLCLLEKGVRAVVYMPSGGECPSSTEFEGMSSRGFNPCTGEFSEITKTDQDWVYLLEKK
jgi:hypothetical protein